jgi:hypothetical protein
MSLRFMDSFDYYASGDIMEKWVPTGTVGISAGNGRRGTASLRAPNGSSGSSYVVVTLDAQGTWIVGAAFKYNTLPNFQRAIISLLDGTTEQMGLTLNLDGTLSARRGGQGGTILGTTGVSLSSGVWYYLEFKVTIHDSTGAVQIKVDGDSKLSLTGQDTKQTSNATANRILVGADGGLLVALTYDWDDLYICDGQGSSNNDVLGDCRVDCLLPNADGSNSQFTPSSGSDHYAMADDSSPDDDSTYLSDATAGHRDTWNVQNLTALVSPSIKGIQVNITAKKDDAGSRQLKPVIKSGATTQAGTAQSVGVDYRQFSQVFENDPNTSAAWTEAGVNAAEFGAEVA